MRNANVVIIPAGVPRKPGMTRDDLFKAGGCWPSPGSFTLVPADPAPPPPQINAGIVAGLTKAVGEAAPGAIINMISNPVNSTVPIAAETLKKMGVYDKRRVGLG